MVVATPRAVLDFVGVDPNPAQDTRVRLPRVESTAVDQQTAIEVERIIATMPQGYPLMTVAAQLGHSPPSG